SINNRVKRTFKTMVTMARFYRDCRRFFTIIKNQLLALVQGKGLTYGIFAQDQLVGVISYNSLDSTNRIGTIGYWIGVHHQGNGYITKATKTLCLYGFNHLESKRI